ncbi:coatomer subunit alpha [Rhizopus stolonifer]|uniref:Coatomer subunit alpha n=1 Tax=Rhizopus stolonifer TaxID=4846 RepID=A0A367KSY7_RHIST|nr:coatomer subunit alpha [Rhizopus stolonifer]
MPELSDEERARRNELTVRAFPSALPGMRSTPESVISFVSLLSQPRSLNNNNNNSNSNNNTNNNNNNNNNNRDNATTSQSLAFAKVDKIDDELCCDSYYMWAFLLDITTRADQVEEEEKGEDDDQQADDQSTEDAESYDDDDDGNKRLTRQRQLSTEKRLYDRSVSDRMDERFPDLKEVYHSKMTDKKPLNDDESRLNFIKSTYEHFMLGCSRLDSFSSILYDVTRFGRLDVLDTLYYADSPLNTSIVSSVEFDKDDEYFAVGGILKDIKIFDFRMTSGPAGRTQTHCPIRRIKSDNKISCVSWSGYHKSQIASSDYQGVINVWDVNTGQRTSSFTEHKKRAWSVDICNQNPILVASGGDDTTVKVWSLNSQRSVLTFQHKGNICCAKFAPNNGNYLAVGSADHHIICYDLRNPSIPLNTYTGHRKAVSYVKWMNDEELISASTDNSLKLWDRESSECLRTFNGHYNEKNFVGLSINEDWIACGSETNTVHTYHKYSKTPIAQYRFPIDPVPGKLIAENDPTYFVSSVCWKKSTSKLIAANSKGLVRVLELK